MDFNKWLKETDATLFISNDYYHHHAFEIINHNIELKNLFKNALNQKIEIKPRIKLSQNGNIEATAINANHLNTQIRKALKNINCNIDNIDISLL